MTISWLNITYFLIIIIIISIPLEKICATYAKFVHFWFYQKKYIFYTLHIFSP